MFDEASSLLDPTMKFRKSMWGQFWSAHQRFFKYLCIAAKVNAAVRIAKESINNNKVRLKFEFGKNGCIYTSPVFGVLF